MTAAIICTALPASVHASGPHVHGTATLEIAIDDAVVHVNLSSPLDSLLGFEHAPRNEKERQAVRSMASKLHQVDNVLVFTPQAQCRLESAKLESSLLSSELLMSSFDKGKADGADAAKQGTPQIRPQTRLPVLSSATASQAASADEHHDEHAELEGTWSFRCATPGALAGAEVRLFHAFPGLRRLDVAIAGPKGQRSAKLSPASRQLKW
ncbi:MAG TPA: DUF2796 domain-containing protein [Nitrosospira sp.]|nr:DUF2796 domain-containing protein [Nitrosospira sp.]